MTELEDALLTLFSLVVSMIRSYGTNDAKLAMAAAYEATDAAFDVEEEAKIAKETKP